MKTGFAALSAVLAVLALSSAASACERHMQHQTTAQVAITAPVPPPAVQPRAVAEDDLVLPQSKPELATSSTEALGMGMGCAKRAKQETVYLTQ